MTITPQSARRSFLKTLSSLTRWALSNFYTPVGLWCLTIGFALGGWFPSDHMTRIADPTQIIQPKTAHGQDTETHYVIKE